ncbi:MAG: sulfite exporter TauE/SafE family protein [Patescibacteria group bacterium]
MNLSLIFITGLTVGGLTCLAVQGGLLASIIASREDETKKDIKKHALYATAVFLFFKLMAYTILGFILGAFGGAISISNEVQTFMQLLAGLYMIAIALNLLDIHPIFRYVVIQPPRFLTRLVKNQSKSKDIFAPAALGMMTVFIPCGTTLAMEALAISSGNPLTGSAIMAVFILGTIPLFFGVGFITSLLGDTFKTTFLKIAAVAVIFLGITSINGALTALGSPINLQSIKEFFTIPSTQNTAQMNTPITNNVQIVVTSTGYSPNYFQVKQGELVTLKLTSKDAFSCASAFRIPSLGISRNLQPNETQTITFTPQQTGSIPFTCSMGMYTGVIEVI